MERSEEKNPLRATLRIADFVQAVESAYLCSTAAWASR
jgi:hypothetical protein